MTISRRIFMYGLAAVLSVISIPGVSASEDMDIPEDEFDDNEYEPTIYYLEVGECEEMWGGPATEPGWYIHPMCNAVGCCRPWGPFHTREAAVEADRISYVEAAQSENNMQIDPEEIQIFPEIETPD